MLLAFGAAHGRVRLGFVVFEPNREDSAYGCDRDICAVTVIVTVIIIIGGDPRPSGDELARLVE